MQSHDPLYVQKCNSTYYDIMLTLIILTLAINVKILRRWLFIETCVQCIISRSYINIDNNYYLLITESIITITIL